MKVLRLTVTLAVLFFMTGCQVLTGATIGENDDATLASFVKTKLASDKLVTLTRVGVETNNGIVLSHRRSRDRLGSLASQVKGVKHVVNNLQVQKS
jgi:osmotically-inducible protein OsmY